MIILHYIRNCMRAFRRNQEGLAYIEFALSLSILLVLFLGGIEVARYMLVIQKLEKTVAQVTDVTSQIDPNADYSAYTPATVGAYAAVVLPQLLGAANNMMSPYTDTTIPLANNTNLFVIISDVQADSSGTPTIKWQYCAGGLAPTCPSGYTLSGHSCVGDVGSTPALSFTMAPNEEAIVGEAFFNFVPIISANGVIGNVNLYRTATLSTRNGSLSGIAPHSCP